MEKDNSQFKNAPLKSKYIAYPDSNSPWVYEITIATEYSGIIPRNGAKIKVTLIEEKTGFEQGLPYIKCEHKGEYYYFTIIEEYKYDPTNNTIETLE